MTDTLKGRAEKFRGKHRRESDLEIMPFIDRMDLIAEILWARENPPDFDSFMDEQEENCIRGWQSFADHILNCLGATDEKA